MILYLKMSLWLDTNDKNRGQNPMLSKPTDRQVFLKLHNVLNHSSCKGSTEGKIEENPRAVYSHNKIQNQT